MDYYNLNRANQVLVYYIKGNSVGIFSNMKNIILASASPRRKELLKKIGLRFTVDPSGCAEDTAAGLEPHALVRQISLDKANAVAAKHPDSIIIAADTIGVIGAKILGKPHTAQEAAKMLRAIGGKNHLVITGFTVLDTSTQKQITKTVETTVYIKTLSDAEIEAYVRTGEALDKAGAYAIQGKGALLVEKIEGDFYNVMGLPLSALAETLKSFGVDVWNGDNSV
jgi:septum formation protein